MTTQTINKVMLVGCIISEPSWEVTKDQKELHFTIVTREPIKRGDDVNVHIEHHRVRLNEYSADIQAIKKGSVVYVQGKITTKQFVDSDNIKRYSTEIVAQSVQPLDVSTLVV